MPDIDTSPAALRALADYWGSSEPLGLDPRDGSLAEQLLAETERRMTQIVATLRTLAAEKEASNLAPEVVAIRHSFDGYGWRYDDAANGSDWVERALQHEDAELLCVAALPAILRASTVKPDLTVGATDRPERLWLSAPDADGDHGVWFDAGEGGTEYVRADIADDLRTRLAAAEQERDEADAGAEAIEAKFATLCRVGRDCGCSHDHKDHVCMYHSPQLVAAVERAEKAEAERDAARWLPIETAPKDGTPVLVRWGSLSFSTAWPDPNRASVARWIWNHPMPHWEPTDAALMHIIHPTHWVPLPAAPANPEDLAHD